MDRVAVVVLDKLHRFSYIEAPRIRLRGGDDVHILCQHPEEGVQKPFQKELIRRCIRVVPQHIHHSPSQPLSVAAAVDEAVLAQSHPLQIFLCPRSVESDPQVAPRVALIRLVKGLDPGLDQKALPRLQLIPDTVNRVTSSSLCDVVDDVVRTHSRSETVPCAAVRISAETQIQV